MFNQEKMIRFDVINGSYRNVNFVSIFFLALNRNPNIYIYNNHGMGRQIFCVCFFYCLRVAVSRTKILWKKRKEKNSWCNFAYCVLLYFSCFRVLVVKIFLDEESCVERRIFDKKRKKERKKFFFAVNK